MAECRYWLVRVLLEDLLGEVVVDLGLVLEHLEVCGLEQLGAVVVELGVNGLLDAGVVQLALAGGVAGEQPVDGVADDLVGLVEDRQDVSELAGLEFAEGVVDLRICFEGGLGDEAHVSAIGGGVWIFREVHGDGAEIFSAFEPVVEDLDFLFGVRVSGGLVVLEVAGLLCGGAGGDDLGEVVLGLDEIELSLVGVVVAGDLRVCDVDFGLDLFVDELCLGQRAADVALEIVESDVALLELVVEFVLGVGGLDLGELGVDVFIAGGEVELGGALLEDFVVDHLMEDGEPADVGFLRGEFLGGVSEAGLVVAVQLGAHDVLAIDGGDNVGGGARWHPATVASAVAARRMRTAEREGIRWFDWTCNLVSPVGPTAAPALKGTAFKDKLGNRLSDSMGGT